MDLDAARRRIKSRLVSLAQAGRGAPGLIIGGGPSLTLLLPALAKPIRDRWCVMDAVSSVRAGLAARGLRPANLPLDGDLPESATLHLSLRAIGCDPIVLAGLDLCFPDELVFGPLDEFRQDAACELGPFCTIEDQQRALLRFEVRAAGRAVEVEERTGAKVLTTTPMLEERALLEQLIEADGSRGLRTLDLDERGLAKRGAARCSVLQALPQRSVPVELRSTAEPTAVARSAAPLAQRVRSGPLTIEIRSPIRVAAIVPIDPERGGTGVPRHLDSEFGSGTVLGATLTRLGQVRGIERIVLIVPERFDPAGLVDCSRIPRPVEIDRGAGSVFPPEQDAIRAARLWADTAWRGGLGGATIWDEIIAPAAMHAVLARRGIDAALCCGPDWPLVMIEEQGGCESLVDRFREAGGSIPFVAAPGPPGLGACVIHRDLLERLARRSGPVLVGDLWRPHPRAETFPGCVAPVPRVRRSMVRAVFDSMRAKLRMRRAIEPIAVEQSPALGLAGVGGWAVVEALEHQFFQLPPAFVSQHLVIELNTGRRASGSFSPHRVGSIQRPPMTERLFERILEEVESPRDVVMTFGHAGDPLWHPLLPRFIRMARDAGVRGVHVRTELVADPPRIDAMLEAAPDGISVDLHAGTPGAYRALMGINRFERVVENLERLIAGKGSGDPRLSRPLLAVRIQRRAETITEIGAFVDAWERRAGTVVVEGIPHFESSPETRPDPLLPCEPPIESIRREGARRMVILSDGRVPISELDLLGERTIGSVTRSGVFELWRDLFMRRRQMVRGDGGIDPDLRWWQP